MLTMKVRIQFNLLISALLLTIAVAGQTIPESSRTSTKQALDSALVSLSQGHPNDAISVLTVAINENPPLDDLYKLIGARTKSYRAAGSLNEAASDLLQLLSQCRYAEEKDAEIRRFFMGGTPDANRTIIEFAISSMPNESSILRGRAQLKFAAKDYLGVLDDLQISAKIDPENTPNMSPLVGETLVTIKDDPKILTYINETLAIYEALASDIRAKQIPLPPANGGSLGSKKRALRSASNSIGMFRQAISMLLIDVLVAKGEGEAAEKVLSGLGMIEPFQMGYLARIEYLKKHGRKAEALLDEPRLLQVKIDSLTEQIQEDDLFVTKSSKLLERGDLYFKAGLYDRAIIDYSSASNLYPSCKTKANQKIAEVLHKKLGPNTLVRVQ
ncbi:MAG: hypothetical protein ABJA02_03125 [Acidobacteriota bacterium]